MRVRIPRQAISFRGFESQLNSRYNSLMEVYRIAQPKQNWLVLESVIVYPRITQVVVIQV